MITDKIYGKKMRSWLMLLFVSFLGSISGTAWAEADIENKEIQEDVDRLYGSKGAELAKKIETEVRSLVEGIMIQGLNASIYLQGIETTRKEGEGVDPALVLVTDHFSRFCSKDSTSESGTGGECQADVMLQHGDIKLSSVLSGSRIDEKRQPAVMRFMSNLIDPYPVTKFEGGKLKDGTAITLAKLRDDAGLRKEFADMLVNQTLLSVARNSFAEMVAKRSDIKATDQTLMEIFEKQSCQRFLNTQWQDNMKAAYFQALNTCDPAQSGCDPSKPVDPSQKPDYAKAATIEIAVMDAARTCLAFESYLQGERLEALNAAILVHNFRQAQDTKSFASGIQPNVGSVSGNPTGGGSGAGSTGGSTSGSNFNQGTSGSTLPDTSNFNTGGTGSIPVTPAGSTTPAPTPGKGSLPPANNINPATGLPY